MSQTWTMFWRSTHGNTEAELISLCVFKQRCLVNTWCYLDTQIYLRQSYNDLKAVIKRARDPTLFEVEAKDGGLREAAVPFSRFQKAKLLPLCPHQTCEQVRKYRDIF